MLHLSGAHGNADAQSKHQRRDVMTKNTVVSMTNSSSLPRYAPATATQLNQFLHNVTFPYPIPLPGVIDPPRPFGG